MALTEQVLLDISQAERQINLLERQLTELSQPVNIPINVGSDQAVDNLRRDLGRASTGVGDLNRELDQTERELRQVDRASDDTTEGVLRLGTRGVSVFTNLRGSLIGLIGAFGAIQGARAFLNFAGDAVQAASDLEESTSKASVVFGDFSDEINAFARTGPQALGLANQQALEFTATFGNLFTALGLSQQAAAELSPEIVQLGADLASFNNVSVDESLVALRAGLVGEVEPLRRLGVAINAATVEAKALELGLAGSTGEISEAAKVQARYALILEQTTNAQGDFARTADGIANRQRTLNAEFADFRAEVGEALIPAFEALLDVAPAALDALDQLIPVVQQTASAFADNVDGLVAFAQGLGDVARVVPSALASIGDFLAGFETTEEFEQLGREARGAWDEVGRGADRAAQALERISVEQLRTGLIDQLRAGVEPLDALNRQLLGLSQLDLDLASLRELTTQFVQLTDVDSSGLARLSDEIRRFGPGAGLRAEEIQTLREAISELIAEQEGFSRRTPGGNDAQRIFEDAAVAALTEADALAQLDVVAADLDVTIASLLTDQSQLPPEFQSVAGAVSASTIQYLRQVEAINELDSAIGALPGAMQAAGAALRDEEGNIVEDFATFFDNLAEQLAQREAFESNLAILRALGLDDLASVFDEAGLEAAEALADAVANPEKAREAERQLDGQYVGVGQGLISDILEGIEGAGGQINTALIDNLLAAAEAADTPQVRAALLDLAEQLRLEIPVTLAEPVFSPEAVRVRNDPRGGDFSSSLPLEGVNVTINNPTTQDLTTDAARAAQTISAVSRVRSGAN